VFLRLKSNMKRPKTKYSAKKELKSIARERVGPVKSARVIVPKTARKKPKHKKPVAVDEL
jgi:hypothetical protein